jgi:hypothetical protein
MMNKDPTSEPVIELRPKHDVIELLRNRVRGKSVARYRAGTNRVLLNPEVAQDKTRQVCAGLTRPQNRVILSPQFEIEATFGASVGI